MQQLVNSLKKSWVELALAVVLLSAAALRLYNVNWDDSHHVHPDERWISMVASDIAWPESHKDILNPRTSTLNPLWTTRDNTPRNFAYGHLPLYLLVLVANLMTRFAPLAQHLSAHPDLAKAVGDLTLMTDYSHVNLVGRVISAFADLGIIYLVFLLGKHIYDKRVGFLGAAFVAFTVMHIQLAHFCTFDMVTTFFAVLTIYSAVRLVQRGDWFSAITSGGAAGLAVASKFSAMPILLTLVVACGARVFIREARPGRRPSPIAGNQQSEARDQGMADSLWHAFGLLLISLLAAAVAFAITSPFAILDLKAYLNQVKQQGDMVRGTNDWPFTRQYRGTLPYIYHIEQQLRWGMGWPLGLVAFAGLAYVLWRATHRKCRGEEWVILSWVVPYFLITGSFMVKFMRYMLPLTPFLSLMGAKMLFAMHDARCKIQDARYKMQVLYPVSCILVVVISSILYSLAFVSIYSRPHTWLEASRWIYAHVPDGSTIATEHWDDDLPKSLPEAGQNSGAHGYRHLTLPMYEPDTPDKYVLLKDILSQADYIILASNRLYRSIPRSPQRYPISTRYYELLFTEELGFRLEEAFTSYPGLSFDRLRAGLKTPLGWTIVDDEADESFTVYDHPKPLVFKKDRELSDGELDTLFAETLGVEPEWELKPGLLSRILELLPKPKVKLASEGEEEESKTLLLDGPVDELPVIDDFRWNKVASRNHLLAAVIWWLAIELLGLTAWPLAFAVFPNLRDRGYILAKSLGLLFVAYLTWLAASLRLLTNSLLTIWLALSLLLILSLYLFFRDRAQVIAFCRSQFRLIVINELIFALAFLTFVGIRLLNPDLWQPWTGGEKMMEFAFLSAILKSPYFPPYDPYFAGGYINYYYYGQFIVSIMVKLTGIKPSVAFNLAVPTLFALTVGGAFCVVYNLAPELQSSGSSGDEEDEIRDSRFANSRLVHWGLLGSLFVAVLGNLDGMAQMVKRIGDLGGSDFHSTIPGLRGLVRLVPGFAKVLSGQPLPAFDYWAPTRVIPFTINEFPYFSFLFADLHPHMIGIPFTILFLALAFNVMAGFVVSAPRPNGGRWGDTFKKFLGWAVIPLCLGALAVINTWDFPTYLGIIGCAFLLRQWKGGRINLLQVVGFAILMGGLGLALYWPFFKHYKALHVGIGLVKGRTDFWAFITIWGFFLFVLFTFLLTELLRQRSRSSILRFLRLVAKRWETLPHLNELYEALVHGQTRGYLLSVYALGVVLLGVVVLALLRYWVLVLLVPPLVLAALLLLHREASIEELFTCFLIFTGFLILVGCELLYLKDFLQGGDHRRMNTIFKFYIQVWVLFGLAAAVALPRLWISLGRWRSGRPFDTSMGLRAGFARSKLRYVWMGLFFVLLFSACVYPLLGTPRRVTDRFPGERPPIGTLDGMAYMTVGSYVWPDNDNRIELRYDYEAIRWLLANVKGTPVVAEAALPYYREGGSRVASYTGLPSLLGTQHEGEQRYGRQVGQRDGEVRDFYTTADIGRALELIRNLDISYIYVGKLEHTFYDPIGLAKFDRMVEEGYLTVVYSNGEVKIYRVMERRL